MPQNRRHTGKPATQQTGNSRVHQGHYARKRFGQNFLVDQNIIGKIVSAVAPKTGDNLIEIGPGQGAITEPLLERCGELQVVELDRDLIPRLLAQFQDKYPGFKVHQGDALKTDFAQFASKETPLRIVGNLPYNISTPLIFHLLGFHHLIADMHFMLQKEVVERLAASPGTKAYGGLSVMVQYYCTVQALFAVPPGAFRPAPKVESAIVRLKPREIIQRANDVRQLSQLVSACFQQRRKTIRNTLKHSLASDKLEQLKFDLSLRPEQLSVSDFVELSNQVGALS